MWKDVQVYVHVLCNVRYVQVYARNVSYCLPHGVYYTLINNQLIHQFVQVWHCRMSRVWMNHHPFALKNNWRAKRQPDWNLLRPVWADGLICARSFCSADCECDPGGTITPKACNKTTGMCECRPHVTGRLCKGWGVHAPKPAHTWLGSRQCRFLRILRVKNPAVRKSWKWCVRRTQKAVLSLNTSQTTPEANDHGRHASIVKGKRASFANNILLPLLNRSTNPVVKVLLKCIIRFSISLRWYAFCTHISRPLAYDVRISSKISSLVWAWYAHGLDITRVPSRRLEPGYYYPGVHFIHAAKNPYRAGNVSELAPRSLPDWRHLRRLRCIKLLHRRTSQM